MTKKVYYRTLDKVTDFYKKNKQQHWCGNMIKFSIKLLNELGACYVYQHGQLIPDVSVSLGCQTDYVHINPPPKDLNVFKQSLESESLID